MQDNKTASLVEASILAAISVLFGLAGIYLPVIGAFIGFIWSVPVILLGVRHGLKWSALCLAASGVLIALIAGPVKGLLLVCDLGFVGLTLGWTLRKGLPPERVILWGALVSFLSKILLVAISVFIMGLPLIDLSPENTAHIMESMLAVMDKFNLPPEVVEQQKAFMQQLLPVMARMIKAILPVSLLLGALFDTFVNFHAARLVLRRLGTFVPDLLPFREWVVPQSVFFTFTASLLLMSWQQAAPEGILHMAGLSVFVLSGIPLVLQGVAVFFFFFHKYNLPGLTKSFFVAIVVSFWLVTFPALMIVGMMDFVFDFRKIRPAVMR